VGLPVVQFAKRYPRELSGGQHADGVEMAVPMEKLGLKPGNAARVLIVPDIFKGDVGMTYTPH